MCPSVYVDRLISVYKVIFQKFLLVITCYILNFSQRIITVLKYVIKSQFDFSTETALIFQIMSQDNSTHSTIHILLQQRNHTL